MVQRIPIPRSPRPSTTVLAVLAIMALAVGGCFFRLVLHPTDVLTGVQRGGNNDLTAQFLAVRAFPAISWLERGQMPRWNPYSQFGTPFAGNPQSGVFYPPNWIFLLIDSARSASWLLVLHHVWGGLGVFCLCRRHGVSAIAAAAGFAISLAAPFLIVQTGEGHFNQICVVAWIPWAFLAYEGLRSGKPGGALLVAIALAMSFFAGHAQEVFYLALILTLCLLADVGRSLLAKQPAEARSLALRWLAVGVVTAGLVAVELPQVWVYTKYAVRSTGFSLDLAGRGLTAPHLTQLWNPWALGGPENFQLERTYFWETLCYFGIGPLVLAVCGAIAGWRRFPAARYSLIAALGLLFAFGSATPLFPLMFRLVLGISFFRMPSRALFFCSFAVAVLAAFGVDAVQRWLGQQTRKAQLVALALALACVAELSVFSYQIFRTIPQAALRSESAVTARLAREAGLSRVIAMQELLNDREAWTHGLFKLQAYEPVPLTAGVAAMDAAVLRDEDLLEFSLGFLPIRLDALHKPMVDLLGVRYAVVSPQGDQPIAGWKRIEAGRLPAQVTPRGAATDQLLYEIYENESPLPRAFVVGDFRPLPRTDDQVQALAGIDPRKTVMLARDELPGRRRSGFIPAQVAEYTPNRVAIDVELKDPGYLVLTDTCYPGWSATDNGQPIRVLRANLAFRAVPLTPGQHRVEFNYSPPGYAIGVLISLLTVALSAGACLRRAEVAAIVAGD